MTEIERYKLLVKEQRRLFREVKQNFADFQRLAREVKARVAQGRKRRKSN